MIILAHRERFFELLVYPHKINYIPMHNFFTVCFLLATCQVKGQLPKSENFHKKNIFKYLEIKTHFGAFIKSEDALGNSGLLDNGCGGVTMKLGWQLQIRKVGRAGTDILPMVLVFTQDF